MMIKRAGVSCQHVLYIFLVFAFNCLLILGGVLAPYGIINIIVVGITHFRDTLFVLIRIIFRPCVKKSSKEPNTDEETPVQSRNVLCVVTTYKEDADELTKTLDSLVDQDSFNGAMQHRLIVVCDGIFKYGQLFNNMVFIDLVRYKTFKGQSNRASVILCDYKGVNLVVFLKEENGGKKDSLILVDRLFVHDTFPAVRKCIYAHMKIDEFHYLFHTDADSIISSNTMRRQSRILQSNSKISGVTGIVLVPKKYGFWSLFQGFQYFYGQLIRRLTESYWGKVTCMPGCTNMINISHSCIQDAGVKYQKLPSKKSIIQIKNRLLGTDRRYTNCVLKRSKDVKIVTDYKSLCYTEPPQSLQHFQSQRKRWTSNAITGFYYIVRARNIPWYVRVLACVDLFRIHTCLARIFSTVMLLISIKTITLYQVVLIAAIILIPYGYFFIHAVQLGWYGVFLIVGSILSKCTSQCVTVYIFVYSMLKFGDITWGKTHGAPAGGEYSSMNSRESSSGILEGYSGSEERDIDYEDCEWAKDYVILW